MIRFRNSKIVVRGLISILFLIFFSVTIVNASVPAKEDEIPSIGKSTKKLSWRSYKIPTLEVYGKESDFVYYYENASNKSKGLGGTGKIDSWRYLFSKGDYYAFLYTYSGSGTTEIAYVKKTEAKVEKQSENMLVRKAGTYRADVNNSNSNIAHGAYYIKALKGKTGSVIVSEYKNGSIATINESFKDGAIISVGYGYYVIVKNAELLPINVAPKSKIEEFVIKLKEEEVEKYSADEDNTDLQSRESILGPF